MTDYEFSRLEAEHYGYMYDRFYEASEYEEEKTREYIIDWHNEEFEDCEFLEAENEEEAREKAEEILPEDAVIDEIRVA